MRLFISCVLLYTARYLIDYVYTYLRYQGVEGECDVAAQDLKG